jgi:hypothetical protein
MILNRSCQEGSNVRSEPGVGISFEIPRYQLLLLASAVPLVIAVLLLLCYLCQWHVHNASATKVAMMKEVPTRLAMFLSVRTKFAESKGWRSHCAEILYIRKLRLFRSVLSMRAQVTPEA